MVSLGSQAGIPVQMATASSEEQILSLLKSPAIKVRTHCFLFDLGKNCLDHGKSFSSLGGPKFKIQEVFG